MSFWFREQPVWFRVQSYGWILDLALGEEPTVQVGSAGSKPSRIRDCILENRNVSMLRGVGKWESVGCKRLYPMVLVTDCTGTDVVIQLVQ